jgi:hypothetical protein
VAIDDVLRRIWGTRDALFQLVRVGLKENGTARKGYAGRSCP